MTTGEAEAGQTSAGRRPAARDAAAQRGRQLKDNWWRHLVAMIAVVAALFPVVFIVSSAFNRDNTLQARRSSRRT